MYYYSLCAIDLKAKRTVLNICLCPWERISSYQHLDFRKGKSQTQESLMGQLYLPSSKWDQYIQELNLEFAQHMFWANIVVKQVWILVQVQMRKNHIFFSS